MYNYLKMKQILNVFLNTLLMSTILLVIIGLNTK